MKLQFALPRHQALRETHRGAGAVRHTNNDFQIFRQVLPSRLLPQERRRCDPPNAKLQPLVLPKMACPTLSRSLDSFLFRPRSTRCLQLCHRKRHAPNREERRPCEEMVQNSGGLTDQIDRMPTVPLQQHYAGIGQGIQHAIVRGSKPAYYSMLSPLKSIPPLSPGKRGSRQNATPVEPQRTGNRLRTG